MEPRSNAPRASIKKNGFSLIEVLIALTIISVAALGLLSAQLNSLRAERNNGLRASAMQAAEEMASRIQTNFVVARTIPGYITQVDVGFSPVSAKSSPFSEKTLTGNPSADGIVDKDCINGFCSPEGNYADLANFDLFDMDARILRSMGRNARMHICLDNTNYSLPENKNRQTCRCNKELLAVDHCTSVDPASGACNASFPKTVAIYCVDITWNDLDNIPQSYRLTVRP